MQLSTVVSATRLTATLSENTKQANSLIGARYERPGSPDSTSAGAAFVCEISSVNLAGNGMKNCMYRFEAHGKSVLACAVLGLWMLAGCGGPEGPKRYDASGKVSVGGTPVVSGRITFAPDDAKGNKGPVGYAVIQNGKYDTAAEGGKGVVAGEMTVLITGFGEPVPGVEFQVPIFEDYKTSATIDSTKSQNTLDFDVPAPTKKGPAPIIKK